MTTLRKNVETNWKFQDLPRVMKMSMEKIIVNIKHFIQMKYVWNNKGNLSKIAAAFSSMYVIAK